MKSTKQWLEMKKVFKFSEENFITCIQNDAYNSALSEVAKKASLKANGLPIGKTHFYHSARQGTVTITINETSILGLWKEEEQ